MKIDFERFAHDFHIRTYSKEDCNIISGSNIGVDCPFCGAEDGKAAILKASGKYKHDSFNCWVCGKHPLQEYLKIVVPELSYKEIEEKYGKTKSYVYTEDLEYYDDAKLIVKPSFIELPGKAGLNPRAAKYIASRGLSPRVLTEKYGFRSTDNIGHWKFRVVLPIYFNHRVVSFQARSYLKNVSKEDRYLFPKKEQEIMYTKDFIGNVDHCKRKEILLVEGYFDMLKMTAPVTDNEDSVGCTWGTTVTENQINFLAKNYRKVMILFDPEEEAQKKANKLCLELNSRGVEAMNVFIDNGKDPGKYTIDEVIEVRSYLGLY